MNVFDLQAKIGLDTGDYDKGLDNAESKFAGFGSRLKSGIAGAAKAGAKILTAVSGAAVAGMTALSKAALANYGEYEQLVGGVETLFGSAQKKVMQNAANAYKTAGKSASEYMATITSFAASLKQSTSSVEEAANVADMAMRDMSDNANKMGTSMESIQNAYQGFAKQNYTMLDNLKLGYGGTKTEMERLLKDAEKLSGVKYNIENLSDVYQAIHVIQTELGITGTTAKEAESTIQGSMGMLKASWQNLLTGFADPSADLGLLMDNVVKSASTVLTNVLPVIKQTLSTATKAVAEFIPTVAKEIPGLLKEVLPALMSAADALATAFVDAIPQLISIAGQIMSGIAKTVIKLAPKLLKSGIKAIKELLKGFSSAIPEIMSMAGEFITQMTKVILKQLPGLLKLGAQIISKLADGLADAIPGMVDGVVGLLSDQKTLTKILNAGVKMLSAIIDGIPQVISAIVQALPDLVNGIVTTLTTGTLLQDVINAGVTLLTSLVSNTADIIKQIVDVLPGIVESLVTALTSGTLLQDIINAGVTFFTALIDNVSEIVRVIIDALPQIVNSIVTALTTGTLLQDIINAGVTLLVSLVSNLDTIITQILAVLPDIVLSIVNELTKPETLQSIIDAGITLFVALIENVTDIINAIAVYLPDFIVQLIDALTKPEFLKSMLDAGIELVSAIFGDIPKLISTVANTLLNLGVAIGKGIFKGIRKGIGTIGDWLFGSSSNWMDDVRDAVSSAVNQTKTYISQQAAYQGTNADPKNRGRLNAYASGTNYAARGWAMVGENGPELMYFGGGEKVVPANRTVGALNNFTAQGEQQIISLLQQILERSNTNIVLDDGTLIGHVDRSLGSLAARKARGN